jgi:hypothetical protein
MGHGALGLGTWFYSSPASPASPASLAPPAKSSLLRAPSTLSVNVNPDTSFFHTGGKN